SWGPSADDRERWLRMFVDFWGGTGAWDALREEAREEFRRVGWIVRQGVMSLTEDRTPFHAFAGVAFRVTLVTGELSPSPAQRVIERLGAIVPGARRIRIPRVGHMAPVTHADIVNRTLLDTTLTEH